MLDIRSVRGRLLVQDKTAPSRRSRHEGGYDTTPTDAEMKAMIFALASGETREIERDCLRGCGSHPGIGAGQMSRVDASRIADLESE